MPAEVIPIHGRRAVQEASDEPERVPLAVQPAPGAVALVLPFDGVDRELWLSPEQAFELAKDLWNSAREAKEAERG